MRFQINEIRVKSKTPCPDQFSWLQRLAIKWLKIPITEKHYYVLSLSIFKENYLIPGMVIYFNPELMNCMVTNKDPNDKSSVVIIPNGPMTNIEIKYLCSSKEGAFLGSSMPEGSNFKRQRYA